MLRFALVLITLMVASIANCVVQCSVLNDSTCAAAPSEEELSAMPAKELKELLRALGLAPKGTKKSMLARLLAADGEALKAAAAEKRASAGSDGFAELDHDLDPSRFELLSEAMRICATTMFKGANISTEFFFSNFFGQEWVHLTDVDGKRAPLCSSVFHRGLVRPLLGSANQAYLNKHVNVAVASETLTKKCTSNEECVALFDGGDATVVVGAIEYFRPAASMLARELKRRLGLWVHINAYYTPGGNHHGFGLHTDATDGLIVQLEGEKLWEVCGYSTPDLSAKDQGVIDNMGIPHRSVADDGDPKLRRLYQNCTQLLLRAGDTLYMPAGQMHMAWSTAIDSLHVTIGIQRNGPPSGHTSMTWSRLIEFVAAVRVRQRPPYEALAAHPRLHRVPHAIAAPGGSGFHGALRQVAFDDDLPVHLFEELVGEYEEEIAQLLPMKTAGDLALDQALRDHSNLMRWVTIRLHQTASSAMPVGLLHYPSRFPHHSKASRAWEAARILRNHQPALTETEAGI